MPVCVVKLCKNNSTKNKKDTGITYHRFPVDPVILDRWTAIVRLSRQECWWKPGKCSVICSAHFKESDFYCTNHGLKRLCKGTVPQNALFLSSTPFDLSSSNSTEIAGSSTPVDKKTDTVTGAITPPLEDFSDTDSLFDSPRMIRLKKKLHNKSVLQLKHARIIKTLREKNRRLKKTICNLRSIIKSLKQSLQRLRANTTTMAERFEEGDSEKKN